MFKKKRLQLVNNPSNFELLLVFKIAKFCLKLYNRMRCSGHLRKKNAPWEDLN